MNHFTKKFIKLLKENGGCSLSEQGSPETGYMVSKPNNEIILSSVSEAEIEEFLTSHEVGINEFFGGWIDDTDGKVYLDISENVPNLDKAVRLGIERNQLAIYDLNSQESIYLKKEGKHE